MARQPKISPLRQALLKWRGWRCSRKLWASQDPAPTLARVTCQAVTHGQCKEPAYAHWCAVLGESPRLNRKQWEHVYTLAALEQSGCFAPGKRGLGFGVGREPIPAVAASRGCSVLATDLAPMDPRTEGWQGTGQYGGDLGSLQYPQICPEEVLERQVQFAYADMRDLSGLQGGYDFLWSSCALEHLGSLDAGLEFIRKSQDLLRPGGVAVHTTELNVSSLERTIENGPVVLYLRSHLEDLARELREAGYALELNFQTGRDPEDLRVDVPPYDSDRHLKILFARHATTSFGLLVTKAR